MPRTGRFSERDAKIFWSRRDPETIITQSDLQETKDKFLKDKLAYETRIAQEKVEFANSRTFANSTRKNLPEETVDSLSFWIKFLSWTYRFCLILNVLRTF